MEQVSVTVYDFRELSSDVQDKLVEQYRNTNVEGQFWFEDIVTNWKEKLETFGFDNPKIYFSGFGCQGDGACFTCKDVDLAKYADHLIMQTESYDQAKWLQVFGLLYDKGLASAKIYQVGNYTHENSISLQYEVLVQSEDVHQRFNGLMDHIEQAMVKISKAIYRDLEDQHEYLTDDISVMESFRANEMKFLSDGSIWA